MTSSFSHQFSGSDDRVCQSLSNDRCQNILSKSVFEHFDNLELIGALLLASKSLQNSSFGANFVVNYVVDHYSIALIESVLSPSSCLSLQFVPSLHFSQLRGNTENVNRSISNFVSEFVNTKYLHLQLRSLTLECVTSVVVSFFFGKSSNAWPQLQDLSLEYCGLDDTVLEIISKNAVQLRTLNLAGNRNITDSGLEFASKLSNITSLDLGECDLITDVGVGHVSKLSGIISLNLFECSKITCGGLERISKLSHLTSLNLFGCYEITDAGLEHVSKLVGITELNLNGCYLITLEAKTKLKIALPNCTIA